MPSPNRSGDPRTNRKRPTTSLCRTRRDKCKFSLLYDSGCPSLYSDRKENSVAQAASFFAPHPNLADEVNRCIVRSEIEGGVFLEDLPPATVPQIHTQHHCYMAVLVAGNSVLISGHPQYCPQPVLVAIAGSTWGGSMLKRRFVGRGMHLEFCHPEYLTPITTSPVKEIRECPQLSKSVRNWTASINRPHSRRGDLY